MDAGEIKFRGISHHGWVYGSLMFFSSPTKHCSIHVDNQTADFFTVRKETIGQFTGLIDKNLKEIYAGDIVDAWVSRWPDKKTRGVVIWNKYCAAFQIQYEGALGGSPTDFIHKWHFFEVIGNTYENSELVKWWRG
jgi:uncharacterized phage protein (TIGR01671 family)